MIEDVDVLLQTTLARRMQAGPRLRALVNKLARVKPRALVAVLMAGDGTSWRECPCPNHHHQ